MAEPETDALRVWLAEGDRELFSSDLARTELYRAVRRVVPERLVLARAVLDSLTLLEVTTTNFHEAGRVEPTSLSSLDSLHLVSALDLGDELEALVAYDERLLAAARLNGIPTLTPA
ncbi:MAG: PIN domain-containing protein [Microthrixaceae bacterium]